MITDAFGGDGMENRARRAIEKLYDSTCTVYEYQNVTDEVTKISTQKPVVVWENQPCRLSFESISVVEQSTGAAKKSMSVKLFISPEVSIKAGSKIAVTTKGVTTEYANSGIPAIYSSHQEIMLNLFERWA